MIVVLSVMDGFENQLKKRLMSSDLHILITPKSSAEGFLSGRVPVSAFESTSGHLRLKSDSRVKNVFPVLGTEAILKFGRVTAGVFLKGVDSNRIKLLEQSVTESVTSQLLSDREGAEVYPLSKIYLGKELADEIGVSAGDAITLISPTEMEGPTGSIPKIKKFMVAGIYQTGLPEYELHTAFTDIGAAQAFLRERDKVSQWEVNLERFEDSTAVANEVRKLSSDFVVKDYVQMNEHLFHSLRLERIAMFIILAFIIVVASFNIVTTLTLMVLQKRREISILRAMGTRADEVSAIFVTEGLLIGGGGVFIGSVMGFILCWVLKTYPIISLPEVYYDRRLPVSFDPAYYVMIAASAFLIVLLACFYPAKRAAAVLPLDGIRT